MKTVTLLCLMLLTVSSAQATHLIGGYIQAKPISGSSLTYEVTVTLYMYSGVAANQATSLSLCFGDGSIATVTRATQQFLTSNTTGSNSPITVNTYRINHTYVGPGTYTLTTSSANRTPAVNITNSLTQQEPLTLTTTFTTSSAPNQTPTIAIPASGFYVALNQQLIFPFRATDADGDSLVYGLAKSLTNTDNEFCNYRRMFTYQFPNEVTHQGIYKLNNLTGDLTWNAPTQQGNYSVAITVSEYRKGTLLSQTTQEVALIVQDLPGTPGTIPPYEPAIEGLFGDLITATTQYPDTDFLLTTFPSPVDDRLQVVVQLSNPATVTIALTDVNGRELHKLTFNKAARQHEQVIGMGSLTPGIYILRASMGERSVSRKIIKQ